MKRKVLSLALALVLCLGLSAPASVAAEINNAGAHTRVSAGGSHTAAIDGDGVLWMWGNNDDGQLGNGGKGNDVRGEYYDYISQTVPVQIMDAVTAVSCGESHTAAIKTDGSLWMWGNNEYGELGNGGQGNTTARYCEGGTVQNTPVKILDSVTAVNCGAGHTAAIKTDGGLWTWGNNDFGQVGNGGKGNVTENDFGECLYQTVPVEIMDGVAAVSCGWEHTAAIKTDGTLWVWGSNDRGQLGNGGEGNATKDMYGYVIQTAPVKILDGVTAVSCGGEHTAALKTDGTLWMWGSNSHGQLGNGGQGNTDEDVYPVQTVPVKVMDDVAAVSCGWWYTAAIKTDGTLWVWGSNECGQLGNGGQGNSFSPGNPGPTQTFPVKVMDDVAAVSCGNSHIAAVDTDGGLWTWGYNFSGELGNGRMYNATDENGQPTQTVPQKLTAPTVQLVREPNLEEPPQLLLTLLLRCFAWGDFPLSPIT